MRIWNSGTTGREERRTCTHGNFLCITWLVNLVMLRGILNTREQRTAKEELASVFNLRDLCVLSVQNSEGFCVLAPGLSLVVALPLCVLCALCGKMHFRKIETHRRPTGNSIRTICCTERTTSKTLASWARSSLVSVEGSRWRPESPRRRPLSVRKRRRKS